MTVKEKILQALLSGETLSGETLATRLGVTRAAVWKAVQNLREDGYPIQAGTNRGYVLGDFNRISEQALQHYGTGGFETEVVEVIRSTNDRAKALAAEGKRGFCIISDRQTGGKGRMGRSFYSPAGCGLYLSLVPSFPISGEESALLTTYAAVAVAESIEELTGTPTGIKWVNDLLIHDKKVCGILSEASVDVETHTIAYAVIGIGINVRKTDFPPEVASVASDLETETGVIVDRNRLASAILTRMAKMDGELRSRVHLQRYRERLSVLGRELLVTRGTEQFTARAVDLNDRGELIVETENGKLTLHSGEVSTKLKR